MDRIRIRLNIGTEEEDNYPYLGNRLEVLPIDPRVPNGEFGVRLHQEVYCDMIETRILPRARALQPEASTTKEEYDNYRTDLGQVVWTAGNASPFAAYDASALS